jgi:hypothetical protein
MFTLKLSCNTGLGRKVRVRMGKVWLSQQSQQGDMY